jgi:hypothetical protein
VAAKRGKSEVLQKLLELTKKKLTTEEINCVLILATDDKGRTVRHMTIEGQFKGIAECMGVD